MKDLRERCEKIALSVHGNNLYPHQAVELLEAFAREIRNEALEEAATEATFCGCPRREANRTAIRALKHTVALASKESSDG